MEKSDASTYRWLSKVVEDGQFPGASGAGVSGGGRYACPLPLPGTAQVDATEKAHPLSLPTALELSDVAPHVRWPRFSKRKRQLPTREEHPQHQPAAKKPDNEFERKPRHRTRKDRYEYKTGGSPNKKLSNTDNQKTKRQRRSRKQTMNDGFHASNVARNRLTLPIVANLGIFNRGRASSPVNLRGVPNVAFSETSLLSRKDPKNLWASTATLNQQSKEKEANFVYESLDYQNYDCSEQRDASFIAPPRDSTWNLGRIRQIDATTLHHGIPISKGPALEAHKKLATSPQETRYLGCQKEHYVQESQSATPYTWSESDRARTSLDPFMEDHLLDILHLGVVPKTKPDPKLYSDSKHYYTLQDLKALLEARKVFWPSKAGDVEATFRRASNPDLQREPTTQTPIILEDGFSTGPMSRFDIPLEEGKRSSALDENPEQVVFGGSGHQHDCKGIGSDHGSPHQVSDMVHADMSDDEDFFRALHAEFCAIMKPPSEDGEPAWQRSKAHKAPEKVDVFQNPDDYCLPPLRRNSLTYSPIDPQLYDQLGSAIPHSTSHPFHTHHAQAALATCARSDRMLPILPTSNVCTEQVSDFAHVAGSRQPLFASTSAPALSHAALPSGFWRQNKLY